MAGWGVEFEFVEDDTGDGQFVSSGGSLARLQALINRGEVDQASRLYEETGGVFGDALREDARVGSNVTRGRIAEVFRRARDFASSALVLEQMAAYADAATLYEQAGDFPAAARCHRSAGNLDRAGPAMERSGELEPALELYRKSGNLPAVAECLVRLHRPLEAALVYRKLGNVHAEVEVLRQVPHDEAAAIDATRRLASLMVDHGHFDRAAALLVGLFRANPPARTDGELQRTLLGLLERLGRHDDARKVRATLGLPANDGDAGQEITAKVEPLHAAGQGPADDYAHLKAIPIFGELALSDLRDLYRVAQEVAYPPGSALIEQGAPSRGLLVIAEGKVDVSKVSAGQNRLLNTLGAGAYVGEIGLVGDSPASARVVAQTSVRVLFISKDAFEHYVYAHPAAALAIFRLFTGNLAERVRALS